MITEEDITQAREQEKLLAESYLKGITDFVKWTSTVAIAAILWVGNGITAIAGLPQIIALVALAFLVSSLIIAVLTIGRVLTAWAKEWDVAREDYSFCLLKKLKAILSSKLIEQARVEQLKQMAERLEQEIDDLELKESEQIERLINAIKTARPFSSPKGFSTWVSWHMRLLLLGLILYILAQVLT